MKDVLSVGVPESGGADTGMGRWQPPRTHVLGIGPVLVGGAGLHAYAWWGRQSLGCV